MDLVALVTLGALIQYFVFGMLVGQARGRFGVAAPAMTGHPEFERYVRVHMNTLEQLVLFLPAIGLFAHYVSPTVAALLGLLFIVGRFLYFRGYVEDPKKRSAGFAIGLVAQAVLTIGALLGAAVACMS